MTPEEVEFYGKALTVIGVSNVAGLIGGWALMKKRVSDIELREAERKKSDEAARLEAERQREAWWEAIEELRRTTSALDKACAVATGNLQTSMTALTSRVDLHTSTNLSAIIGLVKNYGEMLEESVAAMRAAVELLRTAVMSTRQ